MLLGLKHRFSLPCSQAEAWNKNWRKKQVEDFNSKRIQEE
jgi:hypothetical protein